MVALSREKKQICMVRVEFWGYSGQEATKNLMIQIAKDLLANRVGFDKLYGLRGKSLAETGKLVRPSPKSKSQPKLGKMAMKIGAADNSVQNEDAP